MSIFQRKNIKNIFSRATFILLLINVYYIYYVYIYFKRSQEVLEPDRNATDMV